MPAFNAARFIGEALESVLAQTWSNLELIVVDDGSDDETATIVRSFGGRVRYIYQENAQQAAARNNGILRSSGEVLAFIDADDVWLPNKLEKQLRLLQSNPALGMISCSMREIDPRGNVIRDRPANIRGNVLAGILLGEGDAGICGSTPMIPRKALDAVGLFDVALPPCEDTDMFWRIASRYPVDYVDEPLVLYRIHRGNSHANLRQMRQAWEKLYLKALRDPLVRKLGWQFRLRCYGRLYYMLAGDYALAGRWRQSVWHGALGVIWWPPNLIRIAKRAMKWFRGHTQPSPASAERQSLR